VNTEETTGEGPLDRINEGIDMLDRTDGVRTVITP
jgi:hypothetical protein